MKALVALLVAGVCAASPLQAETLRAAVVPIVAQEHFLEHVLEPFLAARGLSLALRATHGREVARAARRAEVDLVIMHERFRARPRLVDDGVIDATTALFANPIALLAPPADPAAALEAPTISEAMRRIHAAGACVLENDLEGLLPVIQQLVPDGTCRRRDASAVGLGAVLLASRQGWYTLWGLHPFAMSEQAMRPRVWDEPVLLRPLVGAAVTGAAGAVAARAAIAYLQTAEARARIRAFRLQRAPTQQAMLPIE